MGTFRTAEFRIFPVFQFSSLLLPFHLPTSLLNMPETQTSVENVKKQAQEKAVQMKAESQEAANKALKDLDAWLTRTVPASQQIEEKTGVAKTHLFLGLLSV